MSKTIKMSLLSFLILIGSPTHCGRAAAVTSKTQTIMSIQKNLEKCFSSEALPICHKLPDLMDIFSKSFKKGIFSASP